MRITLWLRLPSGLNCEDGCTSWTLESCLGFVWWFWGASRRADVSSMPDVFSGGCGFAVPEARVVSEPPSLRWPCAQCPSAPPQLCHCSQTRLGQPRRWRAKQQEIQDSLVYEYSVWYNAACTGPTGAFELTSFSAPCSVCARKIREDPNFPSKGFKYP